MSKQTIREKINTVIDELGVSGAVKEVEWLKKVDSDLTLVQSKELPPELKKKLNELSQKSIAPRGYVDTQGQLDMARWANLLDELAKDLKKTYGIK